MRLAPEFLGKLISPHATADHELGLHGSPSVHPGGQSFRVIGNVSDPPDLPFSTRCPMAQATLQLGRIPCRPLHQTTRSRAQRHFAKELLVALEAAVPLDEGG